MTAAIPQGEVNHKVKHVVGQVVGDGSLFCSIDFCITGVFIWPVHSLDLKLLPWLLKFRSFRLSTKSCKKYRSLYRKFFKEI